MWNDVEFLLNDDTGSCRLTIGSRQECGTALYQVDTLLKISSSEKELNVPKMYAYNSSEGCVIVADRSVCLFDSICQSLKLHLQFDTDVDAVGLCCEGQFLMVGERNGNLHLLHVSSKQILLTKLLAPPSLKANQKTFNSLVVEKDVSDGGTYHMFVLTNEGFFCIMCLHLAKIQEAFEQNDFTGAKEMEGQIKTAFVSTKEYHTIGGLNSVMGSLKSDVHLIIGGDGEMVLSKWKLDSDKNEISLQNLVDSSLINGARKFQVLDNLLFVLDDESVLSVWDVYTLILVWDWPSVCIEDFLLTTEGDSSSSVTRQRDTNLKLIALTVPDTKQMRSLAVYSLPTMNLLYSVEVSDISALVQTGIGTDTIYFLEGVYENHEGLVEREVTALVMRCLTEALPENRLSRLLHKRKFDEAEKFAIQFGLDVELVYKVKLNVVLESLASASVGSYGQTIWQELVDEAKANLLNIKDDHFVVEYCINAPWPTYGTTQEMLNYAKARIQKKEDRVLATLSDEFPVSITEVLRAQARLTTFYGAYGPDKFSGIAWTEFLNTDNVFNDLLLQLEKGNLQCAQYLWLRSQSEFESTFDEKMLTEFLGVIPASVPSKELALWIKNVLMPFVRRIVPKGQKVMAKWLDHRARSLELTDKASWPENGLEMAEVYFTSKNPNDIGLSSSWLWIPMKEDGDCEEARELMKLVNNLQDLVDLHRKYNCKLTLYDFEKETTTTIVFRMLDKVLAPQLIPSTLDKVIRPYMHHFNLQEEELLLQYIKDLLERYRSRSTSLFETAWEAKALAVLGCMSDTDLIFDAVLQIMYGASMPWSETVEQLVKHHLKMQHPKVQLLQESYRLMEMKKLLRDYGIRGFNVSNDKPMMELVKYILKQDTPCSLDDALKVVQAYKLPRVEVYILRIIFLIQRKRGDECMTLLKSLPTLEAEITIERLALWARLSLQEHPDSSDEEGKAYQVSVAKTMVESLKLLLFSQKDNRLKTEHCSQQLKIFEALSSLQEHFDIFLSFEEFENQLLVSQLLEEHINAYESALSKTVSESGQEVVLSPSISPKGPFTEFRLHWFASLLQITERELEEELALRSLDAGNLEHALKICRDAYENHSNEATGQLLFAIAYTLCQKLETNGCMLIPPGMNLPNIIYQLASQAASICSSDLLIDAEELCKHTQPSVEFYKQCQIEDYGFITKNSAFEADRDFYEWTYNVFFSEDGIVLDPLAVIPVSYEVATALMPCASDKTLHPLDCRSLAHCSFVKGRNMLLPATSPIPVLLQNLQECNQCELVLRLVVRSFGSCLQHCVSNNMDIRLSAKLHDQKALGDCKMIVRAMGEKTVSVIKDTAMALLHKVFNCRVIDRDLALGYCTLLSRKDVFEKLWEVINNTWHNYNKILAVAIVGAQLASLYNEAEEIVKFEELINDAEWGIELAKLGISFQSVFRLCAERKQTLIRTLVQNPKMDTSLVLKYCRTFMLNSDAALQIYIETLLLQGASIKVNDGDAAEEVAEETLHLPHSEALARALDIIPLLESTQNLVLSLSGILNKLDPYEYETIEGILTVIQAANEKNINIQLNQALGLLNHLKSYKRISSPGDNEHQYILEKRLALPSSAQTRLPFHMLFFQTAQNFWSIISAELSEESFPTLLLISKLMKVSLDTLHITAVKHIFSKSLKPKAIQQAKAGCSSLLNKETAKTVKAIQTYLQAITNPEAAAAIAHRIAQELPTGPDKIHALKFCLLLAEKWLLSVSPKEDVYEKAQVLKKKLSMQYQRSATENVLIVHRLNTPEFLKQTGKPANLIVSLYEHSSIGQRIQIPSGRDYPDIHSAAHEIAEINNLIMPKICDVLLEKWLCPNNIPNSAQDFFGDIQEDEDLRRVIYLLQPYSMDFSSRILYAIGTSATSPIGVNPLTFAHRSRALHCLIRLADTNTIVSLFKKPVEDIKYYLKCCIFLAEFEMLNIPYTLESFHNSPKEGVIKGLWKNHSHEPRAVRLVTELSLEHHVYDPQLWSGLLQKLLGFSMIRYLRKVLVTITGVHSLWQVPNFSRAWRNVILATFLSASCPPSPKQLEACYECFVVLLKCPVLADLDLVGIAKQYAQLNLPAFTLGCLLLIPNSEKKEQQIQGFLLSCNTETVLQQVADHLNTGEVAGFASEIQNLTLEHIINKKLFGKCVKTKHFSLLKRHVIDTNRIKGLVDYFVNNSCLDDAAALIKDYLKHCGKPVPRDTSSMVILQAFLKEQK
ncbi:kinetochore-associated protein 1 [Ambystoma mexicanum]|uniref:kinetochore-associated protein 1 n=1 Tax=Ambystoma mexicanum TaxID=8296 RepID=UPI0037E87249